LFELPVQPQRSLVEWNYCLATAMAADFQGNNLVCIRAQRLTDLVTSDRSRWRKNRRPEFHFSRIRRSCYNSGLNSHNSFWLEGIFLDGSHAQAESLARFSPSLPKILLLPHPSMYRINGPQTLILHPSSNLVLCSVYPHRREGLHRPNGCGRGRGYQPVGQRQGE
jgi:hypothetical protein